MGCSLCSQPGCCLPVGRWSRRAFTRSLIRTFAPASADRAQGLVRNFLATRLEDGSLDWKPGLAGQRSRLLATPILAHLSWKIYQVSQDRQFLAESFDPLVGYLHAWFDENHDRDGDGIHEWDHPMQAG